MKLVGHALAPKRRPRAASSIASALAVTVRAIPGEVLAPVVVEDTVEVVQLQGQRPTIVDPGVAAAHALVRSDEAPGEAPQHFAPDVRCLVKDVIGLPPRALQMATKPSDTPLLAEVRRVQTESFGVTPDRGMGATSGSKPELPDDIAEARATGDSARQLRVGPAPQPPSHHSPAWIRTTI